MSIGLWRGGGGEPTGPMLLDLGVISPDAPAPPGQALPGPAWQYSAVKFAPDGSRLYASGFGPTVVLDTASGTDLDRIPGTGILAVREGSRAVRILDSIGQGTPITVSLSSPRRRSGSMTAGSPRWSSGRPASW